MNKRNYFLATGLVFGADGLRNDGRHFFFNDDDGTGGHGFDDDRGCAADHPHGSGRWRPARFSTSR